MIDCPHLKNEVQAEECSDTQHLLEETETETERQRKNESKRDKE